MAPRLEQILSAGTNVAYLDALLTALGDEQSRSGACKVLHELAESLERQSSGQSESSDKGGLSLRVMPVPGCDRPIKLILHPAVFSPEHWGRTFAEGLLKSPEQFAGKKIVELGTGSGWISLLLLLRTGAQEVHGLDINPTAVTIARLNAWLNGTTRDGEFLDSQAGVPLPLAFTAAESDLLAEPLSRNARFDHVIGCIPQVLHPDEEASGRVSKSTSQKDLYDLSNYCFQQGILEDRFGLPLIARALEESQLCLNAGGKLTLILGGRPGPDAIDSMFRRRGFEPKLIWSRRIQQADDTDLASLVKLEKAHDIQFHFFMSRDSKSPISADTAVSILRAERPIYHDLLVYEAETRFEKPTFRFVRNVHKLGLDSLRRELDFSRLTEEQVSFLARFSGDLHKSKILPYPHERGDMDLRDRLSRFLSIYCHYKAEPSELFVGPERAQLLAMILKMVAIEGARVLLSHSVGDIYESLVERFNMGTIVANDDLSEICQLDDLLHPDVLVIAPSQFANPSPITLNVLCEQAKKHPERWYVVDDSANFEICSDLNSNMLIRLVAQHEIPRNVVFLYGLIKNTVCPDLELSFLLNSPDHWLHAFDVGSEMTYSRIAFPTQHYYEWLFDDLLSFPFADDYSAERIAPSKEDESVFTEQFQQTASDVIFDEKPISLDTPELIRLDYGEFENAVPDSIVKGLFKGFLEENTDGLTALMLSRIDAYLGCTRLVNIDTDRIALSQGVFPLFGALIQTMTRRLGRAPVVAVPDGSYGPIYPMIPYHGGVVKTVATDPARAFLLDPDALKRLDPKPDLLWLTQPNNPSGIYLDAATVRNTVEMCAQMGIYIMADEIFFLLSDHRLGTWTPPFLSFGPFVQGAHRQWIFLADGIAKAFASGGMRCGFMVCPDTSWAREIQSCTWMPPKSSLRAWDALYAAFLDTAPHKLMDLDTERKEIETYLDKARKLLSNQRNALLTVLKKHNLSDELDTPYRGGLFLISKLAEQRERLAQDKKLLINSASWSRTPGWSRICFGVSHEHFFESLQRLEAFLQSSASKG
jgi:aspartate/methionine/tyrosine aminotransferase